MSAIRLLPPRQEADAALLAKERRLLDLLASCGRTIVAYSGGVDSAYLLAAARRALGEDALGVIARSPSLPAAELRDALDAARLHGDPVRVIETYEMERPGYRANGQDRCFHCKAELFGRLLSLGDAEGWDTLAYGAVTDDLGEDRPGMEAARRLRVRAPLLESGLSKFEVRALARRMGLRAWDKPQAACLASRIPHGTEVTVERLAQVEGAEAWIRAAYGIRILRVRHFGASASLETAPEEIPVLLGSVARIREELARWGFKNVEVDLRGYRRPDPLPVENTEVTSNVQPR
jgi:uncharacterized protein